MASCKYISRPDQWRCPEKAITGDGLCIFHDPDLTKDVDIFKDRFEKRLADKTEDRLRFDSSIFPEGISFEWLTLNRSVIFSGAQFHGQTSFAGAQFHGYASFEGAEFHREHTSFHAADFHGNVSFTGAEFRAETLFERAEFHGWTHFREAEFHGKTSFRSADFHGNASFTGAEFRAETTSFYKAQFHGQSTSFDGAQFHGQSTSFDGAQFHGVRTSFDGAQFHGQTSFAGAQFQSQWIKFLETSFTGKSVSFASCSFRGRTQFAPKLKDGLLFSGVDVDFRKVEINPLDALSFRDADLKKCRFLGTDLRKVEMTNVDWPEIGNRRGVYDEDAPLEENQVRPWAHIERLYRELKQNHEDRRDYERASDFHYGEKEMRRRNPATTGAIWLFLNLYWLVSGYGERFGRPLIWTGMLFVASTIGYLLCGQLEATDISLGKAALHSLQVMTFLRPPAILSGLAAKALYTIESLLGPLFLGLFALAVRQRLKR